jgi:hypothetical protein
MGKLTGIIRFEGSVGAVTVAETENGAVMREKKGPSRDSILHDPKFIRTRENMAEFTRASRGAKLLLNGMYMTVGKGDSKAFGRLQKLASAAVKGDSVNIRGERNLTDGNPVLFANYEYNLKLPLQKVVPMGFSHSITRSSGVLVISIPPFRPDRLRGPARATHFEMVLLGTEAKFGQDSAVYATDSTGVMPIGDALTTALQLQATVTAASTAPLVLALGVLFYTSTNGTMLPLNSGSALRIIDVAV